MSLASERRGFVVAIALYMLAAMAGVAAASFYAVVQVRRAATRAVRLEEASSAADVGLYAALESWDPTRWDSLAIGDIDSSTTAAVGVRGIARTSVVRITESLFWIASTGRAARATTTVDATRSLNLLVEVLRPAIPSPAALVSGGNVVAAEGLTIAGGDTPPPGWSDCSRSDTLAAPAIVLPDGRSALFDDGTPVPDVRFDTAAVAVATSGVLGRVHSAMLAARSTFTVASGAILSPAPDTIGDCQLGRSGLSPTDWGEPNRGGRAAACERFFPVIHAPGDLTLAGGRGQGVLLVSGRLRIRGPFVFHGAIITSGGVEVTGPGVAIYGSIVSAGPVGFDPAAEGVLRRSSCAVARAADAARRAYPIPHRAWSELL